MAILFSCCCAQLIMKEFEFKNVMDNVKVIVEARNFTEAMNTLKNSVKYVEDYFYTADKMKVLS